MRLLLASLIFVATAAQAQASDDASCLSASSPTSCAEASENHLNRATRLPPMPAACQTVFKTRRAALRECPKITEVIEILDFWSRELRGWSCDCTIYVQAPN